MPEKLDAPSGGLPLLLKLHRTVPGPVLVVLGLALTCGVAEAADRGTAYPAAVETADGRILLVSGQGDSRQIVKIDPQWLESPVAADDFSRGLRGWTITRDEQSKPLGVTNASHPDKPGQRVLKLLPTVGRHAAASWNFPSGRQGSLTIRLQIPPGHTGTTLSLTDHFSSPADSIAHQHSAISLELRPAKTTESSVALSAGDWHDLVLNWDSESQVARVVVDDQPEVSIPRRRGFRSGLNYLRINARPQDQHREGVWIERVAASVTAAEGVPQSATGTPPQLIQPAPENESVIVRLPDDSLRIFYVARPDGDQLRSITSHDHGDTWSEPQLELSLPGRAYHAVNVVIDHEDRLHAVFHFEEQGRPDEGYRGRLYNLWHARQEAPGEAWSKPRQFFRGYVGALRGLIALPGGRLLIPFAFAVPERVSPPETGDDFGWHDVTVCYSDDGGRNWLQSPSRLRVIQDNTRGVTRYGGVEPHIAREDDGQLRMLIRTKNGVLYESVSTDGGIRWSDPQPTELISSDSPAWILRLADGREVLFLNSSQRYDDPQSYAVGGREVLHAAIRKDQTQAWHGFREVLTDVSEQDADRPSSPLSKVGNAIHE